MTSTSARAGAGAEPAEPGRVEDRRRFLRRLVWLGGAGPVYGLLGCTGEPVDHGEGVPALTRPVLISSGQGRVRIVEPVRERPAAYVSMARRQVFVDRAYRDRASWLLDAHISVSTALWRIPLPGDPEREPISPGDEAREFEELDIRLWNPTRLPAPGDIRIVRGRRAERSVEFRCAPESSTDGAGPAWWHTAGPWTMPVSDRTPDDTTREDLRIVGEGVRHTDQSCGGPGESVRYLAWACPPGA